MARESLSRSSFDPSAATTLLSILRQRAASSPTRVVYSFIHERGYQVDLTFSDVDAGARRVARLLQSQKHRKFRSGDRVLLWYPSDACQDFIVAFWGCLYAGAVVIVGDYDLLNLRRFAEGTQATIVLTNTQVMRQRTLDKLKNTFLLRQRAKIDPSFENSLTWIPTDVSSKIEFNSLPKMPGSTLACLQYSAGTSSDDARPSMLSHANLFAAVKNYAWIQSYESFVGWMPPHLVSGLVQNVLVPVFTGCRCIYMPHSMFYNDPACWMRLVAKHKAVYTFGPSTAYALAAAATSEEGAATIDLRHLRCAAICDGHLNESHLEEFVLKFAVSGIERSKIRCTYGLAEASGIVTDTRATSNQPTMPTVLSVRRQAIEQDHRLEILDTDYLVAQASARKDCLHLISSGAPLQDIEIRIVDPITHEDLADGVVGEIWVRGASVSPGYWRLRSSNPSKSFDRLSSVFNETIKPLVNTGDLGLLHENQLYVIGRVPDMIKRHDRWIASHLLEASAEKASALIRPGYACSFDNSFVDYLNPSFSTQTALTVIVELVVDVCAAPNGHAMAYTLCSDIVNKIRRDHDIGVDKVVLLKPGGMNRSAKGVAKRPRLQELLGTPNPSIIALEYTSTKQRPSPPSVLERPLD